MTRFLMFILIFTTNSTIAVSANNNIEVTNNEEVVSSTVETVNNSDSKHDGFLNGVKYGISYPFVFWGAEGFEKVPLTEMTGSYSFGAFSTIIVMLVIAVKLFVLKK